ncbi:MAG: hypothetical protein ACJ75T_08775 [Solirubrobacterales bacterium]
MTNFVLGILASVAAALLVGLLVRGRHLWYRLELRRLARRRRKETRRVLVDHLGLAIRSRRSQLGQRRREILAGSFRVRLSTRYPRPDNTQEAHGGKALLRHIARHGGRVHLINAESGFGKTTLGMTLALLPPCEGLTPLYIDLAEADRDEPLAEIESILDRLATKGEARPAGRPLFIVDAMNETVDPFSLCERLAFRDSDLDRIGAKLLFLFSFRHRSFPSRIRQALLAHELGPIEEMELLFDPQMDADLAFFPELVPRTDPAAAERLFHELRSYCERFTTGPVSREDLAAYLRWRNLQKAPDPRRAPSPSSLRFETVVTAELIPGPALDRISNLAFDLLNEEVTARSYAEIQDKGQTGEKEVRRWVEQSGLAGLVSCDEHYVRFQGESTVRVLSALSIARRLSVAPSPRELRGRTSYDVCAPYLQAAAHWIVGEDGDDSPALDSVADAMLEALCGRDAPYSFYATALCSERKSVFGARHKSLDVALFKEMIIAIDEDRGQTCQESLEAAGQSGREPTLDPVLDQLFEVMAAYSRRAVTMLLQTMAESSVSLVKSQAAYLLLNWIESVPVPLREIDQRAIETIPSRLPDDDGNLHFRFHEIEILEILVERFPDLRELGAMAMAKAEMIADTQPDRADEPEVAGIYGCCQELVTLRAEILRQPNPREQLRLDMEASVRQCMRDLAENTRLQEIGRGDGAEIRLECWEVTLGLAVWLCPRTHQTLEITSFLEAALDHPFWIVRWWAFAGLLSIAKTARQRDQIMLAEKCVRRATKQLCESVEPMGVKHRQCALTKRLLEAKDVELSQETRAALQDAFDSHLSGPRKLDFMEGYYRTMGTSPDAYLGEFFRRIADLIPTAPR